MAPLIAVCCCAAAACCCCAAAAAVACCCCCCAAVAAAATPRLPQLPLQPVARVGRGRAVGGSGDERECSNRAEADAAKEDDAQHQ
jgi:hypothetical protein